jgi:nucleotide-binding universal stress UspA family protein
MVNYKKILVAFDGSESSKNALLQAFRLANDEECWITVASVIPPYEGEMELIGVKDIRAAIRKPCDDAIAEAVRMARAEKALITTVCEEGEIYKKIVDLAEAENCDLIVMGRKGRRRIERALVGSVTARVIGHARKDVLVVPDKTAIGWKTILLAMDGSICSEAAADKAIDLAKAYGGKLKVVSAVDIPTEFYAEASNAVENLTKKAEGFLVNVKEKAETAGIATATYIREGEAYKVIADIARNERADVIFMGSHGRTGLKKLLMGSVAERVIGHAPCPVFVVKS